MQPILPSQCLVSFPFKTIVDDLLGESDFVEIKQQTAEIILLVCKNKESFDVHIQSPLDRNNVTLYNKPITKWRLWRLHYWRISTERWLKDKRREDDERNARFLFEANVKMIANRIKCNLGADENVALITATRWLRKEQWGNITFCGVKKLYTNVKEIQ